MSITPPNLTPVSYLVLGLVRRFGPLTPYDLEARVDQSIGYFWSFAHSQLYAEPRRLATAGLLTEEIEEGGRRRRVYAVTARGEEVLAEWVREPVAQPPQFRDLALLKLFFGDSAETPDLVGLAQAQTATHEARLAEYQRIDDRLAEFPRAVFARATVQLGLRLEEAMVGFWSGLAAHPPRLRTASAGAGAGP